MIEILHYVRGRFLLFLLLIIAPLNTGSKADDKVDLNQAVRRNQEGIELLQKDPEKAIRLFREAQAMDPKNPDFSNNIGIAFLSMNRYKEALPYFVRATELDSKYARGYYNQGVCFQRLEKYSNAIHAYQDSLKLTQSPEIYFNLGIVYAKQGDRKNAIANYKKFLEIAPADKLPGPIADAKSKIQELSQ